ncbi:MAG: hypothetical protein ACTSWN_08860 [Promethearchaeota archaeon]
MKSIEQEELDIYLAIVDEFNKERPDHILILKKIIQACKTAEKYGVSCFSRNIILNTLLIATGLYYKDRPIDDFGFSLNSLDDRIKHQVKEALIDALDLKDFKMP